MKIKLILLFLVVMGMNCFAADRYWVLGTGNWDAVTTTNWSTISGGLGGASVPTSADNVIFDSLSNTLAYTVTITATANCADFNMGAPLAGKVTWAGGSSLNIYGSINLLGGTTGITRTFNGVIKFLATTTGKTINTNGITLVNPITFEGVGGAWTLLHNLNNNYSNISLTKGNLDFNDKDVNMGSMEFNNANTRVLSLGNGTITINTSGSAAWTVITTTGLTFNAENSKIIIDNSGTTDAIFWSGGLTYYNLYVKSTGANKTQIAGSAKFNDLNMNTGTTIKWTANTTTTLNDFKVIGTTHWATIQSATLGTRFNLKKISGNIDGNHLDIRDSNAGGATNWYAGSDSNNGGNNLGWLWSDMPPAIDQCLCPVTGEWMINDGSNCTLSANCNLTNGGLNIVDGKLTILNTKTLTIPTTYKIILKKSATNKIIIEKGGKIIKNK